MGLISWGVNPSPPYKPLGPLHLLFHMAKRKKEKRKILTIILKYLVILSTTKKVPSY
jgi:hypothetical protein